MRCEHCPVEEGEICLGDAHPEAFPHFCVWATSPEPREREMVVLRSAIGFIPPAAKGPRPAPLTPEVARLASLPLAGDLLAMATAKLGVDRFARYVADQLGEDCQCEARRVALNRLDSRLRRWLGWG